MIERQLDQFFTTPETAQRCLSFLEKIIDVKNVAWFEPSAGSGVFLKESIKFNMPKHIVAYDLVPTNSSIIEANFLDIDVESILPVGSIKLCLGNPPFGKNSSLAIKFFNHAAKGVDYIAMIFPATFAKDSVKNKLSLDFELLSELDLGTIDFDFADSKRKVPVVFQVWKKVAIKRFKKKNKVKSDLFSFSNKVDADFAIQRVGAAAGKVKLDFSTVSPSSHYFIKTNNPMVVDVFSKIDWSKIKNKTAGNPSIAKTELIKIFEEKFNTN